MRPFSTLPIVLGALMLAPACYNLPHVDPGPRWIDQFGSDAGVPTWNVFAGWTCGTERVPSTPGPSDSGAGDAGFADAAIAQAVRADAAGTDAGDGGSPRMACQMGSGDNDPNGLDQPFAFADSSNDVEFVAATQTTSGTVDFSGFRTFTFAAWLRGPVLPTGTLFRVELVCSKKSQGETVLSQNASDITINAQTWGTSRRPLAEFLFELTSSTASCLSQIDGIRFVVSPGQNDQPEVVGTLSLDSIRLEN